MAQQQSGAARGSAPEAALLSTSSQMRLQAMLMASSRSLLLISSSPRYNANARGSALMLHVRCTLTLIYSR